MSLLFLLTVFTILFFFGRYLGRIASSFYFLETTEYSVMETTSNILNESFYSPFETLFMEYNFFFFVTLFVSLILIGIILLAQRKDFINAFVWVLIFNFFLIYIFTLRYLRLGKDVDLIEIIINDNVINIVLIIVFLWPFISIWIRLFLWTILDIKLYFQDLIKTCFVDLHIYFLRYRYYFLVAEKLYKISFVFISFITHNSFIYKEFPPNWFRKSIHFIWKSPKIIHGIIFLVLFVEFFIRKGHLFYFQYFLFTYLLIRPILSGLGNYSMSSWYLHNCLADYASNNWENPKYYIKFWSFFPLVRELNNFQPKISSDLLEAINNHTKFCSLIDNKFSVSGIKLAYRIVKSTNATLFVRHKTTYRTWSGVRWVHTGVILETSSIWHPMTSYFAKRAVDYAALINNHWGHYHRIEQFKRKIPYYEIVYKHFRVPYHTNSISINKAVEHNLSTNFYMFQKYGVIIQPFSKSLNLDSHNQAQDDIVFDLRNTNDSIKDKRVHGLDQKASSGSSIDNPTSKIFSNISVEKYKLIIHNYKQLLFHDITMNLQQQFQIELALQELIRTSDNLEEHTKVWLTYLHLFPNTHIVPMRVPENFSTIDFDEPTKIAYLQSCNKLNFLSNKFYQADLNNDLNKATEIFDGSELQKLFGE